MSDLSEFYRELILDHNKNPRNRRRLEHADHTAEGFNPLCGDHVTVFVNVEDNVVKEVTFEGTGCAISTASASLMTEILKGKTLDEVKPIFDAFHEMVAGESSAATKPPSLGKLEVFSGVRQYPARVKCATLVWHTLNAALTRQKEIVSTE
jgi:nitrogen fixation NifU-like protein